jgi:hypothetical protein
MGLHALSKIILEIDSAATVGALTKDQPARSRLWWIHEEGKEILHKLQDSKVSHVNREGNIVSIAIAKCARGGVSAIFDSHVPHVIRELVLQECNSSMNPSI